MRRVGSGTTPLYRSRGLTCRRPVNLKRLESGRGRQLPAEEVVTDGNAEIAGPVVALDVGGTRIKAAVVAADGSRLTERRYPTGRTDGSDAVLRRVADVAAETVAACPDAAIVACGLASCGTVGLDGLVSSVNIGWSRAPLGRVLGDRLGLPVAVLNDVHAGAIGEGGPGGAAHGESDYLYIALGTGIGAAIVKDGRLVRGAHGHAGELGHISVDPSGRPCGCGGRGCLETLMSAVALEARWLEAYGEPVPARQIIDRVIDGDPAALTLWEESAGALTAGLLTVLSLIDPAMILLGGGLSSAGARLTGPLEAGLRAGARSFHARVELRLARLGDWSACAGAAVAARALATPAA